MKWNRLKIAALAKLSKFCTLFLSVCNFGVLKDGNTVQFKDPHSIQPDLSLAFLYSHWDHHKIDLVSLERSKLEENKISSFSPESEKVQGKKNNRSACVLASYVHLLLS